MSYRTLTVSVLVLLAPGLALAVVADDVVCSGCVGSSDIAASAITGALVKANVITSQKITDGTITNLDISSMAAIDPSKIAGVAWTASNDGVGSGLDADLLDGLDSLQFLRSDQGLSIDGYGNVGIGTVNPNYDLDVVGNGLRVSGSTDAEGEFKVYKGVVGVSANELLRVDPTDWNTKVYALSVNEISGGNFGGTQNASITNSGNAYFKGTVGIGTTTPDSKLSVVAGGDTWSGSFFGQETSNQVRLGTYGGVASIGANNNNGGAWTDLAINPGAGNVGIGTTVPVTKLHIWNTTGESEVRLTADGDNDALLRMTGQNGATTEGFYIQYDNSVGDTYFKNIYSADNAFHFLTAAGEPLTIKTNGKIGMGTTNPQATLDVHGSVEVNDLMVYPDPAVSDHGNPDLEGSIAWYIKNQLSNGGTIYLQPGTYYVTSQAIPLADNLAIIGSGPGSIIRAYNLTDDLINNESIALGAAGVRNVTLRDFTLVGNGYTDWYEGAPDVGDVQDCIDIGGQTDEANYDTNITLSGLTVSSCGRMGIVIKHTNELTMSDIFISGNGTSPSYHHNIYLSDINNAMLTNIETRNAAGNGVKISHVNRATLTNIITRNNGKYGIRVDANSKQISIASSSAYDNGASGFYLMTDGGGAEDVTLSGCTAYGNTNHGIEITYSDNVSITGCVLRANDQDGIRLTGADNIVMTGSSIRYNGSDGLELDASSGNTIFLGNINENNGGVDVNGTVTVKDHNI